jgi:PAS domain S-box-containing protein
MEGFERELTLLRQRKLLADFGEMALICPDLDEVLQEACRGASAGLGTAMSKFMQVQPDGRHFKVRSGVGWTPGVVGTVIEAIAGTPEYYSLRSGDPLIVCDCALERRFETHLFQQENGVAAFVNVLVRSPQDGSLLGIFEVDSRIPRAFDGSDVDFLRGYAILLAGCFERFRTTEALRVTERQLRDSERHYRISVELNPQIPWTADASGRITSLDHRWAAFSGLPPQQTLGHGWREFTHPEDLESLVAQWSAAFAGQTPFDAQVRLRKAGGEYRWHRVRAFLDQDNENARQQWYGTVDDIDDRVQLEIALRNWNDSLEDRIIERTQQLKEQQREREAAEAKLRQSQKMEAVGQLTGGIAHDFNNILGSLSGCLEMMQRRINAGRYAETSKYYTMAFASVKRAASLTGRLLAFSRLQPLEPTVLDANQVIADLEDLIRRTMGPAIQVSTRLEQAGSIYCDPNQLENALLNLSINARDAMPAGGSMKIQTQLFLADTYTAAQKDVEPGDYVVISVTDDGCGMEADVLRRAFDPFFTTKKIGEGTGLGLSMIYGFMRQSGGQIRIHSTPQVGTTVTLYFPSDQRPVTSADDGYGAPQLQRGQGEVLLLVEDELGVRETMSAFLRDMGYEVAEAVDSVSATVQAGKLARIDLLITDIGLPGTVNGIMLAGQLKAERPGLNVLFISGFAKAGDTNNGLAPIDILTKPFSLAELSERVARLLGAVSGPQAANCGETAGLSPDL